MTNEMASDLATIIRVAKNTGYYAGQSNNPYALVAVKAHAKGLEAEAELETLKEKFLAKYGMTCPV